jgi:hypothetical protein
MLVEAVLDPVEDDDPTPIMYRAASPLHPSERWVAMYWMLAI